MTQQWTNPHHPSMRYRGNREGATDYFDDIQPAEQFGGLSGSEGMVELMTPKPQIVPEGLQIRYRCTWCGWNAGPVIEWSELMFIAHNLHPQQPYPNVRTTIRTPWYFDSANQVWTPDLGHVCRSPQRLGVTKEEADYAIKIGLAQRAVANDPTFGHNLQILNAIRQRAGMPRFA